MNIPQRLAQAVDRSPLAAVGFNPYYQRLGGLRGGRTRIDGEWYYDLASNDYLGLAGDPRVHAAMAGGIREYGSSMCGTPIATGYAALMRDVEDELAQWAGVEAALLMPSCYQANVALFPSIAGPEDLVIVDHYAHASLVQGIRAAGCKVRPFLHNDTLHLEKQLAAAARFRHAFVVTESVFSTEGSVAPLARIAHLCREFGAMPVVDDSHGLGVLGISGRGILEDQALADYDGLYTASLGKAFAQLGGMIGGPRSLIDQLRYSCPGLIYSTALPPAFLAGLRCVLRILRTEFPARRALMWENHRALLEALQQAGFAIAPGRAPIASLRCGSVEETLAMAKSLFEQGLLGTPFVPPSVPRGGGVVRLIVGAKVQAPELAEIISRVKKLVGETNACAVCS